VTTGRTAGHEAAGHRAHPCPAVVGHGEPVETGAAALVKALGFG
jgi:hypothetical protein